tara:strand:+ start:155 stop:718 length:564 start_codon:yes stop_codon:yes gene_type:complete
MPAARPCSSFEATTVSLEGRDVVTCSYCTPENRASLEDDSDDRIDEESGDRESDDDEPLYPLSIKLKGSTMEPRYQRTLTDVDAGMDQGQQFDIQVEFEPTNPVDRNAFQVLINTDRHNWERIGYIPRSSVPRMMSAHRQNEIVSCTLLRLVYCVHPIQNGLFPVICILKRNQWLRADYNYIYNQQL